MFPKNILVNNPNKPAVIMANTNNSINYLELENKTNQGAHYFRSIGLKKNDHIALYLENNINFLEICWSAQRSGLIYTCISCHLTSSEVKYILQDCKAKLCFFSNKTYNIAKLLIKDLSLSDIHWLSCDVPDFINDWNKAIKSFPVVPIADESEGMDMLYSSGTTGKPKGIIKTNHKTSVSKPPLLNILKQYFNFSTDMVYLNPAPLYHAAPLKFCMAIHRIGGTIICMDRFNEIKALEIIDKYKISHSQWVPTMFVRMLRLNKKIRNKFDLSSMECVIHSAAPCSVSIKKKMLEWWGNIIHEYYSSTEGIGFCTISSKDWLKYIGSVGKAVVGKVHICDTKNPDKELPVNYSGLIFFESDISFSYFKDDIQTKSNKNIYGWVTLGDIGYLNSEGYLFLNGRLSHTIISGGVNLYPQEIENIIINHFLVADVVIVSKPDKDLGERPHAIVQTNTNDINNLEIELIDLCRTNLSSLKCPKSYEFVSKLPRYENGKLYKNMIKFYTKNYKINN